MRVVVIVLIVIFILAGVGFGALNPELVAFDLGFGRIHLPKGAALLAALVVGWLLGGLVAWSGARLKNRRAARASTGSGQRPAKGS